MTGLCIVLAVLLAPLIVLALGPGSVRDAARGRLLEERKHNADARVDIEWSIARKAMNDAAKQSWRNLAD